MRMGTVLILGTALAFAPVHAGANPAVIVAETTFESDLEGWELFPGPQEQLTWEPSGSEPGGYARFEDTSPTGDYARAPADYVGDWSWMDGVGFLHWHHRIFRLGYNPTIGDYKLVIAGPGGRAEFTAPGPPGVTDWESVTAHIWEGDWSVVSGAWSAILADVDTLLIAIEMVGNSGPGSEADIDGLDNVVLGAPHAAVQDDPYVPTSWTVIKGLWSDY
jgi:hypothetical protein